MLFDVGQRLPELWQENIESRKLAETRLLSQDLCIYRKTVNLNILYRMEKSNGIHKKNYPKGQIKSERIHEVIDFPNYQLKNLKDFWPESSEVEYLYTVRAPL